MPVTEIEADDPEQEIMWLKLQLARERLTTALHEADPDKFRALITQLHEQLNQFLDD